jgi:hypothetical protein
MLTHSFRDSDVTVLLHPVQPVFLSIEEKEGKIQSGVHYSRLLSKESMPKPEYLCLFDQQVERFGKELALDALKLAGMIALKRENPVLVSLVRAGTPIGVVLKRLLNKVGYSAPHFTVSIVRDRGLDMAAIGAILDMGHKPEDLVFIDGWTGKGVIRRELSSTLASAGPRFSGIHDELYVIGDIAGVADYAATRRDTLIPSCLLNAPVSGLISRSVTRDDTGNEGHGAAYLDNFTAVDRSLAFVDAIIDAAPEFDLNSLLELGEKSLKSSFSRKHAAANMQRLLTDIKADFGITDVNMIKPGIGEASRVLLRRVPDRLLLSSRECPAVAHLIELANARQIPIQVVAGMPVSAVAIIKDVAND